MKYLRTTISKWFDKLNGQWRAMPVKKQHRYTLLLFSVYALLSIIVLVKVCHDVAKPDNTIRIEHIENPVIRQGKSSAIRKDNPSNYPQDNPPNYLLDKPSVSQQDSITTILDNRKYGRQ